MEQRQDRRPIWLTRRAVYLHLTIVVAVPLFLGLFWWQVQRVREGNTLSWAYVFEWPFFTVYAVYLWWKLLHEQPVTDGPRAQEGANHPGAAPLPARVQRAGAPPGSLATATSGNPGRRPDPSGVSPSEEDEELAAYNRYLAELSATGRLRRR